LTHDSGSSFASTCKLHALRWCEGMGTGAFTAGGDGARFILGRSWLLSQQEIYGHEEGEHYGNDAIHGEECGVQFAEVVGFDQGMFV
jgi:hypothetical protein